MLFRSSHLFFTNYTDLARQVAFISLKPRIHSAFTTDLNQKEGAGRTERSIADLHR